MAIVYQRILRYFSSPVPFENSSSRKQIACNTITNFIDRFNPIFRNWICMNDLELEAKTSMSASNSHKNNKFYILIDDADLLVDVDGYAFAQFLRIPELVFWHFY